MINRRKSRFLTLFVVTILFLIMNLGLYLGFGLQAANNDIVDLIHKTFLAIQDGFLMINDPGDAVAPAIMIAGTALFCFMFLHLFLSIIIKRKPFWFFALIFSYLVLHVFMVSTLLTDKEMMVKSENVLTLASFVNKCGLDVIGFMTYGLFFLTYVCALFALSRKNKKIGVGESVALDEHLSPLVLEGSRHIYSENIKFEDRPLASLTVGEFKTLIGKGVKVEKTPEIPNENETCPIKENTFVRISFAERLLKADKELQDVYNDIKNELMSYGLNARYSRGCESFRLHCKTYVKLLVSGKSLKLYMALDPKVYLNSTIPVGDGSDKEIYKETPLIFKVKSELSVKRCKQLITDMMIKEGLPKGELPNVDYLKEAKKEANKK